MITSEKAGEKGEQSEKIEVIPPSEIGEQDTHLN
jgi:hypothetical protein